MADTLDPDARSFDELLDSVPVRNVSARTEKSDRHALVVRVPIRKRWFNSPPLNWIMPAREMRSLGLDRVGHEVYQMCDGRTRTERIIEKFSHRYQVSFHEARLAVSRYLQMLVRHGVVALVGPRRGKGASS